MNALVVVIPLVVLLLIVGALTLVLVRRGSSGGTARDPGQLSHAELQARGLSQVNSTFNQNYPGGS